MKYPAPRRVDHQSFCQVEGWSPVRDAVGRTGTHHVTFELTLPDGRLLRTRVSHPVNRQTYGPTIWAHILRDQLDVTEAELWECVQHKKMPQRGGAPSIPEEALPLNLVNMLVRQYNVPEAEVIRMTKQQILNRLNEIWSDEI